MTDVAFTVGGPRTGLGGIVTGAIDAVGSVAANMTGQPPQKHIGYIQVPLSDVQSMFESGYDYCSGLITVPLHKSRNSDTAPRVDSGTATAHWTVINRYIPTTLEDEPAGRFADVIILQQKLDRLLKLRPPPPAMKLSERPQSVEEFLEMSMHETERAIASAHTFATQRGTLSHAALQAAQNIMQLSEQLRVCNEAMISAVTSDSSSSVRVDVAIDAFKSLMALVLAAMRTTVDTTVGTVYAAANKCTIRSLKQYSAYSSRESMFAAVMTTSMKKLVESFGDIVQEEWRTVTELVCIHTMTDTIAAIRVQAMVTPSLQVRLQHLLLASHCQSHLFLRCCYAHTGTPPIRRTTLQRAQYHHCSLKAPQVYEVYR
jgi:hypothetical protein